MKVYSLDTRDLIVWELLKDDFKLSPSLIQSQISALFEPMTSLLRSYGLAYVDLKSVLTPQRDKYEVCLFFDINSIADGCYGIPILEALMPAIKAINKTCVFFGDLIAPNDRITQFAISQLLSASLREKQPYKFINTSQFFLVYFNNVSNAKRELLVKSAKRLSCFCGYLDSTYSSPLKDIVSLSISQKLLLIGDMALVSVPNDNDNPLDYAFLDLRCFGYNMRGVNEFSYSSFLSYKIQRSYNEHDVSDQLFSLNAVTDQLDNINNFEIIVSSKKHEYLLREKQGTLKLSGLSNLSIDDFRNQIKKSINHNYIFNIEFLEEYNCIKFNTAIDLPTENAGGFVKYFLVFEYRYLDKQIRLITMY